MYTLVDSTYPCVPTTFLRPEIGATSKPQIDFMATVWFGWLIPPPPQRTCTNHHFSFCAAIVHTTNDFDVANLAGHDQKVSGDGG